MAINTNAIDFLVTALGSDEANNIVRLAKKVDTLESKWNRKMQALFDKAAKSVVESLKKTGKATVDDSIFQEFFMEHFFDIAFEAYRSTDRMPAIRMAKPKAKPLRDLVKIWDEWRKKKKVRPEQKKQAQQVKQDYLKTVQDYWQKVSEKQREGEIVQQQEMIDKVKKKAEVPVGRAKTIVNTETTKYWNQVRREVYDESNDVTHYLFVAVRDFRTTKWCKTRQGLVYKKGSESLDKETPPCFEGSTLILCIDGWKRIDCIGTADYVWTHEERWRRVTKVHRSVPKSRGLFQIGCALATANHPFFERSIGFVEAELFNPEEGVRTSSLNLSQVFKAALDALVQKRPQVLLDTLSHYFTGSYSKSQSAPIMERWEKDFKSWVCGHFDTLSSKSEQAGIRSRAHSNNGKIDGKTTREKRSRSSQKQNQVGQQTREFATDGSSRAHLSPSKTYIGETPEVVFNLDVEEDHTYIAGTYLVHNCHWNCRSEILPLSALNPRHEALINDKSKQRSNRSPEPLPPGWNAD